MVGKTGHRIKDTFTFNPLYTWVFFCIDFYKLLYKSPLISVRKG